MRLHGAPKNHDSFIPTGRIWPSGDFSCGYRRVAGDKGSRLDTRSEVRRVDDGDYSGLGPGWEYKGNGHVAFDENYEGRRRWADADGWIPAADSGSGEAEPLTLANLPNSHKGEARREQYGRKGITGYGKKMVRSAATLIQDWASKRRTTFCTISMPDLPREQRVRLAELWPEYLRQLIQFLVRRLERRGLPPVVCSVTEVQPKRLADGGRAYLHLHLVWPNRPARCGNWAVSALEVRSWSESFLARNGLFPDGAWVRCNVQPVRKSSAGYLSKYMSKGCDDIAAAAADLGWHAIPRQWWNMSKAARDWVKSHLAHGDDVGRLILATVDAIFSGAVLFGDALYSLHEVMLEIDGRPRGVGWRGSMKDGYRKDLLSLLDTPLAC